ncbi:MAG: SRPBCC family protein [Acidimicrobiales bacterium]
MRKLGVSVVVAAIGAATYRAVVAGKLTLDTGRGRRLQPLGPLTVQIAAPREIVFDVIAAPYLKRTPRAMADEIEVVERGADMVLAAHHTPIGRRTVATTVEIVRFERPEIVAFRLVRGPVPHVVERFVLSDVAGSTRLEYTGELGTDFGFVGQRWGQVVARRWVATVATSLVGIGEEAERRVRHAIA